MVAYPSVQGKVGVQFPLSTATLSPHRLRADRHPFKVEVGVQFAVRAFDLWARSVKRSTTDLQSVSEDATSSASTIC